MSYSRFSNKVASLLASELDFQGEQEQIIAYSIENILLALGGIIVIYLVGYVLGAPFLAVTAAISGGILRRLSGGAHLNTPLKCLVSSGVVYGLLGWLALRIHSFLTTEIIVIIYLLALLIVAAYAPVDSPAKPIKSATLKTKLKTGSLCFVSLIAVIGFWMLSNKAIQAALVLGVFYQTLTLLPPFNK